MMKKISIEDLGHVNNSTDKSFEELKEYVARHGSDESEARKWLKERIMHRFVSRILDDAKNQEKRVVIKTTDDAIQLHGENKCNNNKEKGMVQVQVKKQPKQIMQQNYILIKREEKEQEEEEEKDDDDDESLKKHGESSYFYVLTKKRVRFNTKVSIPVTVKNRRKKFINDGNSKKRFPDVGIDPPPDIPDKLKKHIEENGGSDIKLVIMKRIFEADLIRRNNRISIPRNQIRDDTVLTEEEKEFIKHENEKNGSKSSCNSESGDDNSGTKKKKTDLDYPGLVVKLIEPSLEESVQYLKTYDTNSLSYVVTDGWNSVVERHKDVLQIGKIVQLWSFRRRPLTSEEQSKRFFVHKKTPLMNTNLSLVLVIVDGKGNNDDGASTSGSGESSKTPSSGSNVTEGGNSLT